MGLLFDNVYDDIRYVKTNYIDINVTLLTSSKNARFTQGAPLTRIRIRIQLLYPSSASAGVGICLANLAKDHIFLSQMKICLAFFTTETNEIRGLMSI